MKKIAYQLSFLLLLILLFSTFTTASVGLGISPSRMEHAIEGGKTLEVEYTIFNTGTNDQIARFAADGAIAPYVTFVEKEIFLKPEPEPHRFPPTYGKKFVVKYSPPPTNKPLKLSGFVIASGGPAPGSTFGGNIAVAMRVDLFVGKTMHFWDYITKQQWIVGSSVLGLTLLVGLLVGIARKRGIRLRVEVAQRPRK